MKRLMCLLMILLPLPLSAFEPAHFSRVWMLDAEAQAGVARVRVTPDIQDTLTDPDLADLVITDADNQRVPFAILRPRDLHEPLARREVLEYSQSVAVGTDTSHSPDGKSLRLELLHDGRRLVMSIPRGQPDSATRQPPVLEALIGAAEISDELPSRHLSLRLQSMAATDLDCRIRDADRPDEREQPLNLVDQGERHPYSYSATLPVHWLPRAWHLRCFADALPEGLQLERALLLAQGFRDHRQLHRFSADPEVDGPELNLELPGAYRIRAIAITSEEDNLLADVVVGARNGADQPWRRLGSGVLSTLPGEGPEANRLEIDHPDRFRKWQVRVDPSPSRGVTIELIAEVEELVFLPQGAGPWRLYAGSARPQLLAASGELVERTVRRMGPAWQWPLADVSGPEEAGGASALEVPPDPLPWRQIVLWVVLGLAASVLIWISARLLRQSA